jgi:hypothetical protein
LMTILAADGEFDWMILSISRMHMRIFGPGHRILHKACGVF